MAFVYPSPPAIFPSSLLSFSPPFLPPLQPYFFLPFYPSVRRFLPAVSPLFSARLSLPLSRRPTSSRRCRMPRAMGKTTTSRRVRRGMRVNLPTYRTFSSLLFYFQLAGIVLSFGISNNFFFFFFVVVFFFFFSSFVVPSTRTSVLLRYVPSSWLSRSLATSLQPCSFHPFHRDRPLSLSLLRRRRFLLSFLLPRRSGLHNTGSNPTLSDLLPSLFLSHSHRCSSTISLFFRPRRRLLSVPSEQQLLRHIVRSPIS